MKEFGLGDANEEDGQNGKSITQGNQDFVERFDGRGRKIKVRLVKVENPQLYKLGSSCATVNFKPETLIT